MPMSRLSIWPIGLALGFVQALSHAQEVWIAPNSDTHYLELLRSAEAWPKSAKTIKVFKISTQFAIFATDAQFAEFVEGTKRLNLEIAMEGLMLTGTDRCGQQVEGYTG